MVKLGRNENFQNTPGMSIVIPLIGLVALVISLFYGIKLKWFRYRLTMNQEEVPVMMRSQSVTEIRENCSNGTYRQSLSDETPIMSDNQFRATSISAPSNVKSKGSSRESIFRWPFRSKVSLTRSTSNENGHNNRISTIESSIRHREEDPAIAEKNERLRRSIYERLNSSTSMSMPDLVQCEDQRSSPSQFLTIQKGIEVSYDEDTIDEIKEISVPIRAKIVAPIENVVEIVDEEIEEEDEIEIPPRPPTPIRRRSRSNSLKPKEEEVIVVPDVPPPIKPRKKNINYSNMLLTEDGNEEIETGTMTPKSILKTENHDNVHQSKTNVQFLNVPDSSSEDEDYESKKLEVDVWQKIDIHREELMKQLQLSTPPNSPPPLPKTPPPTADSTQRDFSFA